MDKAKFEKFVEEQDAKQKAVNFNKNDINLNAKIDLKKIKAAKKPVASYREFVEKKGFKIEEGMKTAQKWGKRAAIGAGLLH